MCDQISRNSPITLEILISNLSLITLSKYYLKLKNLEPTIRSKVHATIKIKCKLSLSKGQTENSYLFLLINLFFL